MAKERPDLLGAVLRAQEPFVVVEIVASQPFLYSPPHTFDDSAYLADLRYLHFLVYGRVFAGASIGHPKEPLFRVEAGGTARIIAIGRDSSVCPVPIFLFPARHIAAAVLLSRFDTAHPLPDRQYKEEDSLRRFLHI